MQNKKPTTDLKQRIKEMDKTIRSHFRLEKRKFLHTINERATPHKFMLYIFVIRDSLSEVDSKIK